jgi:anti-sigma B factor antagonist
MPLDVNDDAHGDRYTLSLGGELDIATAPELEETITRLCDEGAREIVLDLHELHFIDSSGLRAVLAGRELCERNGCELSLARVQPRAQPVFELTPVIERLSFRGRALAKRITRRRTRDAGTPVGSARPDFEVVIDLNLDAPRSARNYVRDLLGPDAPQELRSAVALLTSELVLPIVRRAPLTFLETGDLRVWLRPDTVRVELRVARELLLTPGEDGVPDFDWAILDQIADCWSIEASAPEGAVWFEIARRAAMDGDARQASTAGDGASGLE